MLTRQTSRIVVAVIALLSFLPADSANAQAVPSDSVIHAILATRIDSGRAPGIVVGVLEHGRQRFIMHGSAGGGRPAPDAHTIFEIGSISKTFTGLLLAEAVWRGEVRLEQPVLELLPPGTVVPSRGDTVITLEHLATHRSGLPRLPFNIAPAHMSDPYADYSVQRLYEFLASHQLRRPPGERGEYSNLGAGLLGHALTVRANAASWGALVESRITGPLGMRETFTTVPDSLRAQVATGHNASMDSVPGWNLDALAGAGALRSTAADMLTYLAAHLDTTREPLGPAMALVRTPRADFGPAARIALGWIVAGSRDKPIWWHNGGTGGFRTFAAFDPARQIAVVVLGNSSVTVDDIGMHLMNPALPLVMPVVPPRVRSAP